MTTPFRQYLAPLERSRRLIAGIVAGGLIVGIALAAISPTRYQSEAAIFVAAITADPTASLESTVDNVDMETEVRIAQSRAVAERAAQRFEGAEASDIVSDVEARAPKGSRVLEITFEAASASDAQIGAQAMAEEYLAFRSELARQQTTAARDQIQQNIDTIEQELATNPDAVRRTVLQGELAAHQEALAQLSTVVLDAGEIIDDAPVPTAPSTVGFFPIVLGSVAGALAVAVGVAYLLDNLRRREGELPSTPAAAQPEPTPSAVPATDPVAASASGPRPEAFVEEPAAQLGVAASEHAEDVQAEPLPHVDAPPFGWQPPETAHNGMNGGDGTTPALLVAVGDLGPTLDHLKELGRSGPVVAAVFDADATPAAARVAFALAWKTAELGARTLVIDVNPQASTAHQFVAQGVAPGLAEVLDGTSELVDVVREVSGPRHIALVTAGAPTDTTGGQLAGDRFADVISRVKQHYQVVVLIGGRPANASSAAVASQADGIVLATTLAAGTAIDDPQAMASVGLSAQLLATVSAPRSDQKSSAAPASAPMS